MVNHLHTAASFWWMPTWKTQYRRYYFYQRCWRAFAYAQKKVNIFIFKTLLRFQLRAKNQIFFELINRNVVLLIYNRRCFINNYRVFIEKRKRKNILWIISIFYFPKFQKILYCTAYLIIQYFRFILAIFTMVSCHCWTSAFIRPFFLAISWKLLHGRFG